MPSLKIGTRKSELARTQTQSVIRSLEKIGYSAQEHFVVTKGDIDKRPLSQISGDGFFTKEIEKELLAKNVQMAVHSAKDLPSMTHRYLPWVAFGERETTTDVLIRKKNQSVKVIGTSSPRRTSQLKKLFPESEIVDLRGNVPTRIEKAATGVVDAAILAGAGIRRLNLQDSIYDQGLEIQELPFTTAPCQGILGVQAHFEYLSILEKVMNADLTRIAHAEKSLLALLGGGCHLSVGAQIQKKENYTLDFFYDDSDKVFDFKIEESRLGDLLRRGYSKIFPESSARVWLTQPIQHHHNVALQLAHEGFQPVSWPLVEIQTVWDPKELENLNLADFGGIIFSSQFAAQIFLMEWVYQSTDRFEDLKRIPLFAVGDSTAQILSEFDVTRSPSATSESLATILPKTKKPYLLPGTPLTQMASKLQDLKIPYKILPLYETAGSKSPLRLDTPELWNDDKIVLTSPSAVEQFIVECKTHPALSSLPIFAIGPTTGKALANYGIQHQIPKNSGSWDSLIEILKN